MPALLFALVLLAGLLPGAARAASLELVYQLHAGGFHVGAVTARVTLEDDGRYRIDSSLHTIGLVGWLTEFASQAATEGRVRGAQAQPAWHHVDNVWRGRNRTVRVRYHDGMPLAQVVPPAAEDHRPEVPAADLRGAIDPLSAGLALALAASGPPGQVIPVYDGRRRYDLIMGAATPEAINDPVYSGPVQRMIVQWRRVGGYAKPPSYVPSTNMPDFGTLWVMPPQEASLGLHLPVRLMIDSHFGAAVIRLSALRRIE